MNREEVTKLFRFFSALNAKWKPAENAVEAWAIVLEPYRYEDVRRAATICFRQHNYIPDPAEIVAEMTGRDIGRDTVFTPTELTILDAYKQLQQRRIEAGLPPTPSKSAGSHLSILELMDQYDSAGLGLDSIGCEVKRVKTDKSDKEDKDGCNCV